MALNLNPKIFDKLHDTPQKSALVIGLGTLALVIALFVFAIVPATSSVVEQFQKNKRRNELVLEQETKIANLNKLITAEETYVKEIGLLNENYPVFVDSEYIVKNIQDYVDTNSDLKIASMEVSEGTELVPSFVSSSEISQYDKYNIKVVDLNVTYNCTIQGAVGLLDHMENFPSLLNIKQVGYSYRTQTEESSSNLPLNCSMALNYYTKTLKPPAPESTIVPTATVAE